MKKVLAVVAGVTLSSLLIACSPEVGTKAWCEAMGDKPRGDWTVNEATDFAKYCVLKNYKE
ncbi:MAG: DUF3012 domain-containing protein [Pseudomonadales bacterium]